MPNYHISYSYFGEEWDVDIIAFDIDITYKGFLTFYIREGFRVIADMDNVKDLVITPIK